MLDDLLQLEGMTKPVTVRLDEADYDRLRARAAELATRPSTLARDVLHTSLSADAKSFTSTQATARLAALDRLVRLSEGQPSVDAVQLVEAARWDLGAAHSS